MKILLLPLAAFLLVGCGKRQDNPVLINNSYVKYEGTPVSYAYEFRLADGTRCVAYRNSITCDWQPPVVLLPRVE